MAKNIYVGNLPYNTTGDDLVELFQSYGTVTSGQVIIDKFSGRSRGFGFVEMPNDDEAQTAIDALNGSDQAISNTVTLTNKVILDRNETTDLGLVEIPIIGK